MQKIPTLKGKFSTNFIISNVLVLSFILLFINEYNEGNLNINSFVIKLAPTVAISLMALGISALRLKRKSGSPAVIFWVIATIFIVIQAVSGYHKNEDQTPIERVIAKSSILETRLDMQPAFKSDTISLAKKYFKNMGGMAEWKGRPEDERASRAITAALSFLPDEQVRESDKYVYALITKTNPTINAKELLAQIRMYPIDYIKLINKDLSSNFDNPSEKTLQFIIQVTINTIPLA
ncbi:hypothetical protein [Yersinia frederiksenii]|uniref:hypothetical protein n=1 Tax=Yersinia frederiksenii TaxID=29484 RepID=UPI000BFE26B3|nr:hypothetical protein [Yersinia frederiksenii]ATM86165.1 hypothetical protein CRN74_08755 [Yersinia frederiksenii]